MLPITTNVLPAPQPIIEMVKCQCKTNCSTQRCSCRKSNLQCAELCSCDTEYTNNEDCNIENEDSDDDITYVHVILEHFSIN